MVILPGVALAAGSAFSQTASAIPSGSASFSHKAAARYSSHKAAYKVPKSAAKQAKYIKFLTALLSLSPSQQAEAASIFASASTAIAEVRKGVKATRVTLGESVANADSGRIRQTSAMIGSLAAQRHTIGANANLAFYQLLTADQQYKLTQFRS